PDATVDRFVYELGDRGQDTPALPEPLGEILRNGGTLTSVEVEHEVGKSGRRTLLLNTRTLARGGGRPDLILLAIEDITERKRTEEAGRQHQAELAHVLRVATIEHMASGLAHELNQPLTAIANEVEACATYVRGGKLEPPRLLALLEHAGAEALRAGEIV